MERHRAAGARLPLHLVVGELVHQPVRQRRGPRAAMAYRLVHEFTDYEVLRVWGTPVKVDIEPLGNL
ncbi:hypothetical protein HLK59_49260 [Streptomyces sp. S3(2020)]|nr:hypothetical protein [Streptomyces sp. S3(2020)]